MALELHPNFVSAQYLELQLMDFDQSLVFALISTRSMSGLLPVNFHNLITGLWPLIDV